MHSYLMHHADSAFACMPLCCSRVPPLASLIADVQWCTHVHLMPCFKLFNKHLIIRYTFVQAEQSVEKAAKNALQASQSEVAALGAKNAPIILDHIGCLYNLQGHDVNKLCCSRQSRLCGRRRRLPCKPHRAKLLRWAPRCGAPRSADAACRAPWRASPRPRRTPSSPMVRPCGTLNERAITQYFMLSIAQVVSRIKMASCGALFCGSPCRYKSLDNAQTPLSEFLILS